MFQRTQRPHQVDQHDFNKKYIYGHESMAQAHLPSLFIES